MLSCVHCCGYQRLFFWNLIVEDGKNQHVKQALKEMNRPEPHKLTPAETPKQKKKEQSDEITREIARYLAMGKKIEKIPTGKGVGNSEQNF